MMVPMAESEATNESLAPTLLLSMPQLSDPNFHQTVVLLCEHNPAGAFGLVLNRPTETPAASAVQLDPPILGASPMPLWAGGPVEPHRGWILLGEETEEGEALEICRGLYLSTSPLLLRRLLEGAPSRRARLLNGYAGWGPGQLDEELAASAWLTSDVELDLVFDTEAALMWEAAIRRLGADPALLQMSHGVH
jgi:putative transcriptional regulator